MKQKGHIRTLVLVAIILFGALWRVIMPGSTSALANFTPVGAMALFGGCYFLSKPRALLLPLAALFLSDIVLMQMIYPESAQGLLYSGWVLNYGIFALIVLLGMTMKKVNILTVIGGAVGATLVHWIISNFGVWLGGNDFTTSLPFTKDIAGFIKCYDLALPFLKNTLVSNLLFSAVFFGAFELAKIQFPSLKHSWKAIQARK